MSHTDGIVAITDANTTIAYCRYDPSGEIEYLFVAPAFRRRGYAKQMLGIVESHLGIALYFSLPISPLGRHVVGSYSRGRPAVPEGDGDHAAVVKPQAEGRPIMLRNSRRVSPPSRKAPIMRLVTIVTPALCTPRVVMH